MANKDASKQWFKKGDYPTEEQFAQVYDWLRWKDEGITIADVANLQQFLNTIQATLNSIIPSKIISGGLVTIKSDDGTNVVLQIDSTAYSLKGIPYTVPHSEVTVTRPADETLSRFDVFYLDETGFRVLKGVESAAPVKPQLLSGLELTTILIGFNNTLQTQPMPGTQSLQSVTLVGNVTSLPLVSTNSLQAGQKDTGIVGAIKADLLTLARTLQLPDKSGTFAMLDDVTGSEAVIDDTAPSSVKVYSSQKVEDIAATKLNVADYNEHYKGKFTSLAALQTALPAANAGDYAQVDTGAGSDVINYNWDVEDGWIEGGSGSAATNTDQLPEGSSNLYFTAARVIASVLTGLSVAVGGDIVSTDTILSAFGKIQKRFNDFLLNFNGANQLVQLDATGKLPGIDGSQLTNLPTGGAAIDDNTTALDKVYSSQKTQDIVDVVQAQIDATASQAGNDLFNYYNF